MHVIRLLTFLQHSTGILAATWHSTSLHCYFLRCLLPGRGPLGLNWSIKLAVKFKSTINDLPSPFSTRAAGKDPPFTDISILCSLRPRPPGMLMFTAPHWLGLRLHANFCNMIHFRQRHWDVFVQALNRVPPLPKSPTTTQKKSLQTSKNVQIFTNTYCNQVSPEGKEH